MSDLTETLRHMANDPEFAYAEILTLEVAADELDRLNAQALELCAEISGLRRDRDAMADLYRQACEERDDARRELAEAQGLIAIYQQRDGQILDLQREIGELRVSADVDAGEFQATIAELEADLGRAQRELAEARVIIRKTNGSVRHFENGAYLVRLYHEDFDQMARFLAAAKEGER
jgi:chromosome segregation ATPase